MKNSKYILYAIIVLFSLNACNDLLDQEATLDLTEDVAIRAYTNAQGRLMNLYTCLPDGFFYLDGAMMAAASDEAEFTKEFASIQKFNTGAWNALDNPDEGAWSRNFAGIRGATLFLSQIDSIQFEYLKNDPSGQSEYIFRKERIENWKQEARFLRAFFYFELIKRYGGVPVLNTVLNLDTDFASIPRNSLADCVQYIEDECDTVIAHLPAKQTDPTMLGTATGTAAWALKSKVALFAASNLFSDPSWAGGYAHPELISIPGDRQAKWEKAAKTAWDAIQYAEKYKAALATDYAGLFKSFSDDEIILTKRYGSSNTFEKNNFPIGYDLGKSGTTPSQNLVDAYEMTTGEPFDWNNPQHAADPYTNRDPRLAQSIVVNNTPFNNRNVEIWTGGRDGKGKPEATKTGYYLNKYVDFDLDLLQGRTVIHSWIIFRLSELYLNYAEALNESDPGNADIAIYVNKIRTRPSVDMPPLPTGLTQAQMQEKIRNERRVEFAFEDQRFWDVRRWMIAESTLNVPLRGVEITKTGDNFNYKEIKNVENRVFEKKMYFYPIPQNDLQVGGWVQNPLW
jgi:hypothetical protein